MNVNVADAEISPIELEIIYNALTAAAAEMDVTIWRTSRSTIVRELLDYSTAIFDRDGWNVAQAARIPSHLNSMSYFLTEILARHIPPDRWGPDDIVISNDPYCGGQHLPDIVAYKAVFRNGRRIGFVGALCHHLDVGGSSPGSYGSSATEIFQEGLRIPPVKIVQTFVGLGKGKRGRAEAMWAAFGDDTIGVMRDGCHLLAVLWESAWALGDGERTIGATTALTRKKAMEICAERDFLPSLTIDRIGRTLTRPSAPASAQAA